jgi:hypothetical protein
MDDLAQEAGSAGARDWLVLARPEGGCLETGQWR